MEAEAIALQMAIQELAKLQYHDILFVGDCKLIYDALQNWKNSNDRAWCSVQIKGEFQDISMLSIRNHNGYKFMYVPRKLLVEVDLLAKMAKMYNMKYTVYMLFG